MNVPGGWYAILGSSEIGRGKPLAIERFGTQLVAWRDAAGNIVVMNDRCPHRSAKLSLGTVNNSSITCPYHGFQFGSDGACQFVPETGKAAPNLKVEQYCARDAHGFVWLWWSQEATPNGEIPWFKNLDSQFAFSQLKRSWPTHISRCIENQLDYAHLPYVHKQSIGQGVSPLAKREFILEPQYIRISLESTKNNDSFLEFRFPNIWQLCISPKLRLALVFAPVNDNETVLYLRSYQKFSTLPLVKDLIGLLLNYVNAIILNQDKSVVLSQHPKSSLHGSVQTGESLFPSDRAIDYFRQRWKLTAGNG